MKKLAIFGSSGHACDVADIAIDVGYLNIVFLNDSEKSAQVGGIQVLNERPETLQGLVQDGFQFAIGIGRPDIRQKVYLQNPKLDYPNLIHTTVTFGKGSLKDITSKIGIVCAAGSRISNSVSLGDFCFFGMNSIVGHDGFIEAFSSIMPGVALSGNVHIEKGVYIGCNASIRQGSPTKKLIVGSESVVGMGAVVLDDVPSNHTAIGVPARLAKISLE